MFTKEFDIAMPNEPLKNDFSGMQKLLELTKVHVTLKSSTTMILKLLVTGLTKVTQRQNLQVTQ